MCGPGDLSSGCLGESRVNVGLVTDPSRSVVVEACAGSGKTWLLTARIVRSLLSGVGPSEILALTYTKKAAAEMRARVRGVLETLAMCPPKQATEILKSYGLQGPALVAAMARVDSAYEEWLLAEVPATMGTFHSWYTQILSYSPVAAAPLSTLRVTEQASILETTLWRDFLVTASEQPGLELTELLRCIGPTALREALSDVSASWESVLKRVAAEKGPGIEASRQAMRAARDDFLQSHAPLANGLRPALELVIDKPEWADLFGQWPCIEHDTLTSFLLVANGSHGRPRMRLKQSRLLNKKDLAQMGDAADQVWATIQMLGHEWAECLDRSELVLQSAIHRALCRAALVWIEQSNQWTRQHNETTYDGLEQAALGLIDSELGPALLGRLDCRYRQILVDEFQDTNPVQWSILLAWLEAHVASGGADADAPRVFIVGDPKQAIYRFRGADPLVFAAASRWLEANFNAVRDATDVTRRCSPQVVDALNRLLLHPAVADSVPARFRPHASHESNLPGWVAVLPVPEKAESLPWQEEGERIAQALHAFRLSNPWLEWSEVRILVRGRTHVRDYERALHRAGIPYRSDREGGLLDQPEVQDLLCICRWLAHPFSNADLAQAMVSPLFGFPLADCEAIATRAMQADSSWWEVLCERVKEPQAAHAERQLHQMLSDWRAQMSLLPVHDLLQRIIADSNLEARLADYGPSQMAQTRANLEALLAFTLQWDGGRSPSLARFANDMAELARARDGEGPSVGWVAQGPDCVTIQTIHSAKGLEADLVVLAGLNDKPMNDQGLHWLLDWSEDRRSLRNLFVHSTRHALTDFTAPLWQERDQLIEQEGFNLFYVACTRARRVLLLSAAEAKKSGWMLQAQASLPAWNPRVDEAPALTAAKDGLA